jgi:hypothetical protein
MMSAAMMRERPSNQALTAIASQDMARRLYSDDCTHDSGFPMNKQKTRILIGKPQ